MFYRMLNIIIYNDRLSNIDESVKANVNLIKELIDVRNGIKWVHIIFDMQNIITVCYTIIMCSLM